MEAQLVRISKCVIVRTPKASKILIARGGPGVLEANFHVLPNGRDTSVFRPLDVAQRDSIRSQLGINSTTHLLIYAGSVGPQYCLRETLAIFERFENSYGSAHLIILTFSCKEAEDIVKGWGGNRECITILSASADRAPLIIGAADVGLALRSSAFSMQAVSPVKIGEYLLCGLPVITSNIDGVSALSQSSVVHVLQDTSVSTLDHSVAWLHSICCRNRGSVQAEARSLGIEHFSLEKSLLALSAAIHSAQAGQVVLMPSDSENELTDKSNSEL
ncbi:hypothetical protein NZK27_00720 [Synechococcus sp. FGCU-3]|nr:hypothetical protein [Synechococcus sp. FGCU3]